jgi:multicomponent Na+:H+ antiporter subunit G
MSALEWAGIALMTMGLIFFFGTVAGVHRFPDFYSRMHGAAKGDTLSTMLFVAGILFITADLSHIEGYVRAAKLGLLIGFLFLTSPTASHLLLQAAFVKGLEPWQSAESAVEPISTNSEVES